MFFMFIDVFYVVGFIAVGFIILKMLFVIVRQETNAIIERFGKFSRALTPGIHLMTPFVERVAHRASLRVTQLDIEVDSKTSDNVFVTVMVSVQFNVENNKDAVCNSFYKLDSPKEQMKAFVFDVVRAEIPKKSLDDVFVSKNDISEAIQKDLTDMMAAYGFTIKKSLITDITPDKKVMDAMNSINAAKRNQEAATHEAEAERIRMVGRARAEAESKKLQGEGTANQRKALADGIAASVETLKKAGVSEKEANAILLTTQYLDMQQALGANSRSNVIFTPLDPAGGGKIMNDIMFAISAITATEKAVKRPE